MLNSAFQSVLRPTLAFAGERQKLTRWKTGTAIMKASRSSSTSRKSFASPRSPRPIRVELRPMVIKKSTASFCTARSADQTFPGWSDRSSGRPRKSPAPVACWRVRQPVRQGSQGCAASALSGVSFIGGYFSPIDIPNSSAISYTASCSSLAPSANRLRFWRGPLSADDPGPVRCRRRHQLPLPYKPPPHPDRLTVPFGPR